VSVSLRAIVETFTRVQEERAAPPSITEIAEATGSSYGATRDALQRAVDAGYMSREPGQHRGYRLADKGAEMIGQKPKAAAHHALMRGYSLARMQATSERAQLTQDDLAQAITQALKSPDPGGQRVDGSLRLPLDAALQRRRWDDVGEALSKVAQAAAREKQQRVSQEPLPPITAEMIAAAAGVALAAVQAGLDQERERGTFEQDGKGWRPSRKGLGIAAGTGQADRLVRLNKARRDLGLPPITEDELAAQLAQEGKASS